MIYTVTFNPAVDYVIHVDEIKMGSVNRTNNEAVFFGGKGINVSRILCELGIKSVALGFVAGFTGAAIERDLEKRGIASDFVHLEDAITRINIKIKSRKETEINGRGPKISGWELEILLKKLDGLGEDDILILAGSIPSGMPQDVYEKILKRLDGKGVKTVVDATGGLLLSVLKYRPFLIKPNNHELGELFSKELKTDEEIIEHARMLKKMGAENVLVSMAGDGAILIDEYGEVHRCGICKGEVINSVGAGDSMVAGFIAGSLEKDYAYALKLGTACGGATAFSQDLAVKDEIDKALKQLY